MPNLDQILRDVAFIRRLHRLIETAVMKAVELLKPGVVGPWAGKEETTRTACDRFQPEEVAVAARHRQEILPATAGARDRALGQPSTIR
jgi:hypothetical protein